MKYREAIYVREFDGKEVRALFFLAKSNAVVVCVCILSDTELRNFLHQQVFEKDTTESKLCKLMGNRLLLCPFVEKSVKETYNRIISIQNLNAVTFEDFESI